MKTIRLMAISSVALTMGLVAMDTAHASSIVYTRGGDVWRSSPRAGGDVWSLKGGCTGTARRIARGAVDPDWGPR